MTAGQQISRNGDSGDANGNLHLHFEVHPRVGADMSLLPHLLRASRPRFAARCGSVFRLRLRGNVVAVGADSMSLDAERVRQYPGGRWLRIDPPTIELTLPLSAEVAPSLGRIRGPQPRTLRAAVHVSVTTPKGNATPQAIVGSAGALQVGRVTPIPSA